MVALVYRVEGRRQLAEILNSRMRERDEFMDDDFESGASPGLTRIHDSLAVRGRRIPPEAWPFILLAVFAVAANGQLFLSSGSPDVLIVANVAAPALLPVAILIGCRDAWRSAGLLLLGAIVWTSIPLVVDVVSWAQQWLFPKQWSDPSLFSGTGTARDLAAVISITGPALIAIALEQRRRTETTWPKALVASAVISAGVLCLLAAIGVASGTSADFGSGDPRFVAVTALNPLRLLTVGALAWSTTSAVRAQEEPRRFWLLGAAGSALLLGVSILAVVLNVASYSFVFVGFPLTWLAIAGDLVGMAMLLAGFAQGLPVRPVSPMRPRPQIQN